MTGVYTSFRTRDGALPPTWGNHMDRLHHDAAAVGLTVPHEQELADLVLRAVGADGRPGVRINLRDDGHGTTEVTITTRDPGPASPSSAVTVAGVRPHPGHKLSDDPVVERARAAATRAGTSDALLVHGGALLEADNAAVAIVRGREFATPQGQVLPSITMDEVCRHAAAQGLKVVRRVVAAAELLTADEALLASAVRGIRPLVTVDAHPIGNGGVGPVTTQLTNHWIRDHASPSG